MLDICMTGARRTCIIAALCGGLILAVLGASLGAAAIVTTGTLCKDSVVWVYSQFTRR